MNAFWHPDQPGRQHHSPFPLEPRGAPWAWLFSAGQPTLSSLPASKEYDLRRSEEHTSELQSLMRISYAVFCLKKKNEKLISHYTYTEYMTLRHAPNNTRHNNI